MTFLDTHVVVWLYAGQVNKFTPTGRQQINSSDLFISPIVRLELQYLNEIGRIRENAEIIVADLGDRIGLVLEDAPLNELTSIGINEQWTRDPFDRLIVSHAKLRQATLLTRDATIAQHYDRALW